MDGVDGERGEGPGWRALAGYIDGVDGGPPRFHLSLVKPGTVSAVSVYALEAPPHWHLVTYGLTDLDAKASADPEVSGWGFELTFRLARSDDQRPDWAVNLLANLAAYVMSTGHPFAAGHHVDLRGPIRLDDPTAITAAALTPDPRLGVLEGPFGAVEFLEVVGLTADELELCRAWRTGAVLDLLADADPLLVTRLDRPSLLDDPGVRERAQAGVAAEGSSLAELRVGTLRWTAGRRRRHLVVTMGSGAATGLGPALRRKLNQLGATFDLVGDDGVLRFEVAEAARWEIRLPAGGARGGFGPRRGVGLRGGVGPGGGVGPSGGVGPRGGVSPRGGVPVGGLAGDADVIVAVPLARVDDLAGLFSGRAGAGGLDWLPGLRFVVTS